MDNEKKIGRCTFCNYEGHVTEINQNSSSCDDCLPFVWSRQHPGEPVVPALAAIKNQIAR